MAVRGRAECARRRSGRAAARRSPARRSPARRGHPGVRAGGSAGRRRRARRSAAADAAWLERLARRTGSANGAPARPNAAAGARRRRPGRRRPADQPPVRQGRPRGTCAAATRWLPVRLARQQARRDQADVVAPAAATSSARPGRTSRSCFSGRSWPGPGSQLRPGSLPDLASQARQTVPMARRQRLRKRPASTGRRRKPRRRRQPRPRGQRRRQPRSRQLHRRQPHGHGAPPARMLPRRQALRGRRSPRQARRFRLRPIRLRLDRPSRRRPARSGGRCCSPGRLPGRRPPRRAGQVTRMRHLRGRCGSRWPGTVRNLLMTRRPPRPSGTRARQSRPDRRRGRAGCHGSRRQPTTRTLRRPPFRPPLARSARRCAAHSRQCLNRTRTQGHCRDSRLRPLSSSLRQGNCRAGSR